MCFDTLDKVTSTIIPAQDRLETADRDLYALGRF